MSRFNFVEPIWFTTRGTAIPGGYLSTPCYCRGKWIVKGNDGGSDYLLSSDGGATWQTMNLPVASDWANIISNANAFVAVDGFTSATARFYWSQDGINWTVGALPHGSFNRASGVTANGLLYILTQNDSAGGNISYDGISWTGMAGTGLSEHNPVGLTYGLGQYYYYTGEGGYVGTSPDAINWTVGPPTINPAVVAVFGNGVFVVGAGASGMQYSLDGINFNHVPNADNGQPMENSYNVIFDPINSQFMCTVGGDASHLYYSKDGINWFVGVLPYNELGGTIVIGQSNTYPQRFVTTDSNGIATGQMPNFKGVRFVPANFTKIIQLPS